MAKKAYDSTLTKKIQTHGVFYMPDGALTSELHLAAWLEISRRTVIDTLVHPEECDGVNCLRVGQRFVFRTDEVNNHLKQHATARKRPRKKGGNRRCDDDPPCSRSA